LAKIEYVACCMCGKTVSRNKFKDENFKIDPLEFRILQVREQKGGRQGQGFFDIPEEGKTIVDLWNGSLEDREIVQAFKHRLLSVIQSYVKAGIIKRSELKFPKTSEIRE
jgi:hypothetical protein